MEYTDGCLRLPEEPGIGVEIDMEKVNKYSAYYDKNVKGKEFEVASMPKPEYILMSFRRYFGV